MQHDNSESLERTEKGTKGRNSHVETDLGQINNEGCGTSSLLTTLI